MPAFCAADGTELAYHVQGEGIPLLCVPGGAMRASAYLGDLGGLSAHRQLIMLDLRGTGDSAIPEDPGSYRCDRLVDDVAAPASSTERGSRAGYRAEEGTVTEAACARRRADG
jgi:proline iminopeptidase